jgi:hypothetical protein
MRLAAPAGDVERSVLSILLYDLGRVAEARGELSPEDFSTPGRAVLFATMAGVVDAAEGEEVGLDDITGQLEILRGVDGRAGELAALGLEELNALIEAGAPEVAATAERLRFDLRRVREMAEVRRALRESPVPPGGGDAFAAAAAAAGAAAGPGAGAGAPPAHAADPLDLEGKLRLLKRLHEEGLISEDEYADKRRRLLDTL